MRYYVTEWITESGFFFCFPCPPSLSRKLLLSLCFSVHELKHIVYSNLISCWFSRDPLFQYHIDRIPVQETLYPLICCLRKK